MKTRLRYIIRITFLLLATGLLAPCVKAQSVQAVEYFFDTDPGVGNGTRVNLNPSASIDTALVFDMSKISFGLHRLFVRAQDASTKWGLYHIYPVIKAAGTVPVVVQKVEYYFDSDPGQGNGITVNFQPASSIDTTLQLDLSSVSVGAHQVFFRAMDNTGRWSLYHTYTVIKGPGYAEPLTVNKLEYFFDTDPGVGKATPLSTSPQFMVDSSFLLPVPDTNKDSLNLFVRAMDNRGLWGLYHDTMIAVTCGLYPLKADLDFSSLACDNSIISFVDTTQTAQWKWFFGNGDSAAIQQPVYTFKQSGTYNVSHYIISKRGCISDTLNQLITVQPPLTVNAGPDKEIYAGDDITLAPVITGNDSTYLWTPGTNMNNSGIRNPTITGVTNITYAIKVTGKGGCTVSDTISIKVSPAPQLGAIPNVFSPNGDGVNDSWVIKYLNTFVDCRVQIFNRYGVVVFESNGYPRPWDGRYRDNKILPLGTYYYVIALGKGKKPLTGSVTIIY